MDEIGGIISQLEGQREVIDRAFGALREMTDMAQRIAYTGHPGRPGKM